MQDARWCERKRSERVREKVFVNERWWVVGDKAESGRKVGWLDQQQDFASIRQARGGEASTFPATLQLSRRDFQRERQNEPSLFKCIVEIDLRYSTRTFLRHSMSDGGCRKAKSVTE